jgi:hypothetical protein
MNTYNKYKNQKVYCNGKVLDSKREAKHYIKLLWLQECGEIKDLQTQVKFELQEHYKMNGKTIRAINYVADFTYYDKEGKYHVVDAKGFKPETYKIKKKLFEYKYGIEIEEI